MMLAVLVSLSKMGLDGEDAKMIVAPLFCVFNFAGYKEVSTSSIFLILLVLIGAVLVVVRLCLDSHK